MPLRLQGLVCEQRVTSGDDTIVSNALLECRGYGLADSRLENLAGIKKTNPTVHTMLIRPAGLDRAEETVVLCDVSLESTIESIASLGKAAHKMGKTHNIIIMVEIGDLREGVPENQALQLVYDASKIPGIKIEGIGSTLTCFAGVVPDSLPHEQDDLLEVKNRNRNRYKAGMDFVRLNKHSSNGAKRHTATPDQ